MPTLRPGNYSKIWSVCRYRDVHLLHLSTWMLNFSATFPNLENTFIQVSKCWTFMCGNRTQSEAHALHVLFVSQTKVLRRLFHRYKRWRGWLKIGGRCWNILGSEPNLRNFIKKKKKGVGGKEKARKVFGFWRWIMLLRPTLTSPILNLSSRTILLHAYTQDLTTF